MAAGDESPTWFKAIIEGFENFPLGLRIKIGENQVAAQDNMKTIIWRVFSYVLPYEPDTVLKFIIEGKVLI